MIASCEAIVLGSQKYSDSNKIVTYFSKDHGKIKLLAKGIRKNKSKSSAYTEAFALCDISFFLKQSRTLQILSKTELIDSNHKISEDFETMACGMMILESVSSSQVNDHPNEELFVKLKNTLALMNKNIVDPFNIFVGFQLSLSELLGYKMNLQYDPESNLSDIPFSLKYGLLAESISSSNDSIFFIENTLYHKLQKIQRAKKISELNIGIDIAEKEKIVKLFRAYFSLHMEKSFAYKTFDLIKQMI